MEVQLAPGPSFEGRFVLDLSIVLDIPNLSTGIEFVLLSAAIRRKEMGS